MSEEPFTPLVFISYSHDTREHKQWVLELAQELVREHHVDVILDQWDLEHGDDMARFMRESVDRCDRVLMICTEPYVEKADGGKGGVGYEAMIVDVELIRDLGTKKFVPVIRQDGDEIRLPKSVGTRLGANLSESANREEEMKTLVERLHKLPPPSKPALGGGPAAQVIAAPALPPSEYPTDPSQLYDAALKLSRSGDLVSWRRLINEKKAEVLAPLNKWRAKWEARHDEIKANWIQFNVEGLRALEPLYAVAMAGIESGADKFNRQAALIHDLIEPRSWERSGLTILCDFPQTAAFTFQALLGIFAVHSEQPQLIFDLANQRIKRKYENESCLLWDYSKVVGWPESLAGNCNTAWRFIWSIAEHMPWVAEKLRGEERVKECLCAHYFTLSWIEYIDTVKNKPELLDVENLELCVPALFVNQAELSAGMRLLLEEKETFLNSAERASITTERLNHTWPKWVNICRRWHAEVTRGSHRGWANNDYPLFLEDLLR
ncbi:MAG: toll/interleukin-1 receptor domain-containing protein [Opitutales bacterium]